MRKLTGEEIIRTFINYFVSHGHTEIESASLIPHDDPSILWINAGVTPLKKYFDGREVPVNRRLTSCQKCLRTGDIENVGKTARHHTLFQMLGNFSIGDYFKDEALNMAWELLTSEQYFGLDKNKLYITVYPNDLEAYNKWLSLGVEPNHIFKLEGNFWEIGEGPSGPDSEIFYDRGEKWDKDKLGTKLLSEEMDNDRYIEIWNNVFSQFNAKKDVARENYEELPSKNIDTGMGVERMACIMQDTETNYETDLFQPIMEKITEISNIPYHGQMEFKVIADHIRTLVFAISDGATFENVGRGYVLRRLLRRSVKMGKRLNISTSFLAELVDAVMDKYASVYPYLLKHKEEVKDLITKEEELFHKTLLSGEKKLEEIFNNNQTKIISGEDAFKLFDTFGFPIEMTEEYAAEKGFTVDLDGYQKYMLLQKEMARNSRRKEESMNIQNELLINYKEESTFVGYDKLGLETTVIALIKGNNFVDSISDTGYVVLKENPFYAESGGQISDSGYLKNDNCKLEVLDVIKAPNKQHLLYVKVLEGTVTKGDSILTHVLKEKRDSVMKNHSCAHLLQRTLRDLLGNNVHQAGCKIEEDSFRFDFAYHGRLSDAILEKAEEQTNGRINAAANTIIEYTTLDEAKKKGAMALFEDKYGDTVRVVTMGDSIELCAGTHVKNTKDIGRLAILSVENKGADTYRITASTDTHIQEMLGKEIKPYNDKMMVLLEKAKNILAEAKKIGIELYFDFEIDNTLPTGYKDVVFNKEELERLNLVVKNLEKEFLEKKANKSISDLSVFLDNKEVVNDINILVTITTDYEVSVLKQIIDALANQLDKYFILIANVNGNSVNLLCHSNYDKVNCGSIVKELASKCSGNGGGSPTFAQGGGSDSSNIITLLGNLKEQIKEK